MSVISRLPHIPADEIARALDRTGRWALRVEALRPGDASWVNLSNVAGGDWVVGVATQGETQDQVVGRFTVTFLARADGRTVAPGVSAEPLNRNAQDVFAPFLYAGTFIRVYAGNAAEGDAPTMRLWIRGRTEKVEWQGNDVALHVNTPDAELDRAWITTEGESYGAEDPGVPLAMQIQSFLNNFGPGDVSLRVLPDDDFPDYALLGVGQDKTSRQSLRPFLHQLARRPGADLRYVWDEAAGDFTYTLYLPPRYDTTVRFTLDPARIDVVPLLEVSSEHVRNDFETEFPDPTAKGGRRTLTRENLDSQQQFGKAYMFLGEGDESSIRTAVAGANLLAYADHDLAQPPTDLKVRIPFLPWLTLHDVGQIQPDGVRFDYLTTWAVSGLSHNVQAESQEGWYTEVSLRGGSPVGQYYGWFNRAPMLFGDTWGKILKARLIDDRPTEQDWELLVGPGVVEVARYTQLVKASTTAAADPFELGEWVENRLVENHRVTFTIPKPAAGFQRFEGWLPLDNNLVESGDGVVRQIDPIAVQFGEKLKVLSVTEGVATVRASMDNPAPSAFPVLVSLHLDDEDAPAAVSGLFEYGEAPYHLDHAGIELPLREVRRVIARFEAVDGTISYARVAIDRDALASGYVSVDDGRPDPVVVLSIDDDADAAQLTIPGGRTWTVEGLTGSGTLAYEVGETALDDNSTESLLKTGETRRGYTWAVRGGGVWTTVWSQGALHGMATQPPILTPRVVPSADRAAANLYLKVESVTGERLGVRYRDSLDNEATLYTLVSSNDTPCYLDSGTEIGPESLWDNGPGAVVTKFAAIPLQREQIVRVWVQGVGSDSGVPGPWTEIVLTQKPVPWLESVDASFDKATGTLTGVVVGGAHLGTLAAPGSVFVEFATDREFASSLGTSAAPLAEGQAVSLSKLVPAANRKGNLWVRATPYSGPLVSGSPTGIPGAPAVESTTVGAAGLDVVPRTRQEDGTGFLRLEIVNPGGLAFEVWFKSHTGGGDWSTDEAPSVATGWTRDLVAPWEHSIALDGKHPSYIAYAVLYTDTEGAAREVRSVVPLDFNQIPETFGGSLEFGSGGEVFVDGLWVDEDGLGVWEAGAVGGAEPPDPGPGVATSIQHVGRGSRRISTGLTCPNGATAIVRVRGYNADGVAPLEYVRRFERRREAAGGNLTNPYVNIVGRAWVPGTRSGDYYPYHLDLTAAYDYAAGVRSILFTFSDDNGNQSWAHTVDGTSPETFRLKGDTGDSIVQATWVLSTGPALLTVQPRNGSGVNMGDAAIFDAGDPGDNGGVMFTGPSASLSVKSATLGYGLDVVAGSSAETATLQVGRDALALPSSASIQPDFRATGLNAVLLNQDAALQIPLTTTDGVWMLRVQQSGSGGHSLTLAQGWYTVGNPVLGLSADAGQYTLVTIVKAGGLYAAVSSALLPVL